MHELDPRRYETGDHPPHHHHSSADGLATAGLVLGIVGLVFSIIPFTVFIGIICDILGIVFGSVAKSQLREEQRPWTARQPTSGGVTTGVIGLIVALIWFIVFAAS